MGTISSSTGLISGMDIEGTVKALMAIESRAKTLLEKRVEALKAEQTAWLEVSAQMLSLKTSASSFDDDKAFKETSATSSNEDIMTATSTHKAVPGSYTFKVMQLAQSQQLLTRGYADIDQSHPGAGTITVQSARARLDRSNDLAFLNNQQGVRRGSIEITDRSGSTAQIDLQTAITVGDVLDAINNAAGINVQATADGDRIVITDHTGQTASNLVVSDLTGGHSAEDLGIAADVADTTITGSDIFNLTDTTSLDELNDGNGMRQGIPGGDFEITAKDGSVFNVDLSGRLVATTRLDALNGGAGVRLGKIQITDRNGIEYQVDLTGAETIEDVATTIETATSNVIDVRYSNSHKLMLVDTTDIDTIDEDDLTNLKVTEVDGGHTAGDLGILDEAVTNTLTGEDIYDIRTLGDVMRAINLALDGSSVENSGRIVASIASDGNRLELTDTTGGGGTLTVTEKLGSKAATDLGIAGDAGAGTVLTGNRIIAGVDTVLARSLNGGQDLDLGTISITDRSGTTSSIDLSSAETLEDIINAINDSSVTANVTASLNDTGLGITITDNTSATASNLIISDTSGTAAAQLGIAVDDAVTSVDAVDNNLQIMADTTELSTLNGGMGVAPGKFYIRDSNGAVATVNIGPEDTTIGDVIEEINAHSGSIAITASINDTGDGILLTDTGGGTVAIGVDEYGSGTTAADLGILGNKEIGETTIDSGGAMTIEVTANDTLLTLRDKINSANVGLSAAIINDGTTSNPYRLSLTSTRTGRAGEVVIDTGALDLGVTELAKAQQAVVTLGGSGAASMVINSSDNTLDDVIGGVTLELKGTSSSPVTINVTRNTNKVADNISKFVSSFNNAMKTINKLMDYDTETEEKGVLLGDSTLQTLQSQLYQMVTRSVSGSGRYTRMSQIGLSVSSSGTLSFDKDAFLDAFANDSTSVISLFTKTDVGVAERIKEQLDRATRSGDGTITRQTNALKSREDLFNERIEYQEDLLASKEQRLYKEFYAMEQALANMQSQQTALSQLSQLASMQA